MSIAKIALFAFSAAIMTAATGASARQVDEGAQPSISAFDSIEWRPMIVGAQKSEPASLDHPRSQILRGLVGIRATTTASNPREAGPRANFPGPASRTNMTTP